VSTDQLAVSKRRRRIDRTPEFKAQIVATCLQVGVSVTAIARAHDLNPSLVHRWVRDHERSQKVISDENTFEMEAPSNSGFIELPFKSPVHEIGQIELEFRRGNLTAKLKLPGSSAIECTHMIKALFKC
jgi:transposase